MVCCKCNRISASTVGRCIRPGRRGAPRCGGRIAEAEVSPAFKCAVKNLDDAGLDLKLKLEVGRRFARKSQSTKKEDQEEEEEEEEESEEDV
jgi:hypothetical protein